MAEGREQRHAARAALYPPGNSSLFMSESGPETPTLKIMLRGDLSPQTPKATLRAAATAGVPGGAEGVGDEPHLKRPRRPATISARRPSPARGDAAVTSQVAIARAINTDGQTVSATGILANGLILK